MLKLADKIQILCDRNYIPELASKHVMFQLAAFPGYILTGYSYLYSTLVLYKCQVIMFSIHIN